jgi:ABC-type nitrate/sulfonate/bicarbonate transport system substrate-binding protein
MFNPRKHICAAAVAALVFFSPAAQAAETVRLANLAPGSLNWLHVIADKEGFYKAHDLNVEELRAQTSSALLQAVSSGSVEAGISLGDLVIRAVDQGAPVVITGAILKNAVLRLVGAKGSTKAADLAGVSLTAGAVSGGTANMLLYMLKEKGVDPKGVKLLAIANSRDRILALQNGQVAGALLIPPFDAMAQRESMMVLADYAEPYVQTPLIVNTNWAKAKPGAARALTQAFKDAAAWINDPANKDKAIAYLAEYTKSDPKDAVAAYDFIIVQQKAIAPDLSMSDAALQNIENIDAALSSGAARKLDISKYYNASFLK